MLSLLELTLETAIKSATHGEVRLLREDAEAILEELQEQEAVKPQSFDEWLKIERNYMKLRVWRCGYCTVSLDMTDNFCRNCGRKVDWGD